MRNCGAVHDSEDAKPQCSICFRTLKNEAKLSSHYRWCHKGNPRVPEKYQKSIGRKKKAEVVFDCNVCGKGFATKANLRKHLENVHPEVPEDVSSDESDGGTQQKPFRCEVCNKLIRMKSKLYNHMRKEHPEMESDVDSDVDSSDKDDGSAQSGQKRPAAGKTTRPKTKRTKMEDGQQCQMGQVTPPSSQPSGTTVIGSVDVALGSSSVTKAADFATWAAIYQGHPRPHVCALCGAAFTQRNILTAHLNSAHANTNQSNASEGELTGVTSLDPEAEALELELAISDIIHAEDTEKLDMFSKL